MLLRVSIVIPILRARPWLALNQGGGHMGKDHHDLKIFSGSDCDQV